MPPAAVKGVIVSPIRVVARSAVMRGSAKRKELKTAALTWFATWNHMK